MKGATTDPWVTTIKVPIRRILIIKGANQYFLRTLKNAHISFTQSKNGSILKGIL